MLLPEERRGKSPACGTPPAAVITHFLPPLPLPLPAPCRYAPQHPNWAVYYKEGTQQDPALLQAMQYAQQVQQQQPGPSLGSGPAGPGGGNVAHYMHQQQANNLKLLPLDPLQVCDDGDVDGVVLGRPCKPSEDPVLMIYVYV